MKLRTHLRHDDPRRKGTVIVVATISLIAILSFVALSLDGGMLMDKRRQSQSASDAAALAAANELYATWWVNGVLNRGLDPNGTAKAAALATAAANGYTNGV